MHEWLEGTIYSAHPQEQITIQHYQLFHELLICELGMSNHYLKAIITLYII